MYERPNRMSKTATVVRRFVFAGAITLFLALLGTFGGIGYHVHSLNEVSFEPHVEGYADVVFNIDLTYNPATYPLYWVVGQGNVAQEFKIIFRPEIGGRLWFLREDRLKSYVFYVTTWGLLPNTLTLLSIMIAIEVVGRRCLYFAIFGGMIGFAANVIGAFVGMIVGGVIAILIIRKVRPFASIPSLWNQFLG